MEITDIAYMANGTYGIEFGGIHWKTFDTEEEIFQTLINIWNLDKPENQQTQLKEKGGYAGMTFIKCTQEDEDLPEDLWSTVVMEQVNIGDDFSIDNMLNRYDHWGEVEVIKTLAWKDSKVVEV